MIGYVWIGFGGALGSIGRALLAITVARITGPQFACGTILINIIGSFIIGFFGTLTASGSRFAVPVDARAFVMVGICGGFTTFSSFSLKHWNSRATAAWGSLLAISCSQSCFVSRPWRSGTMEPPLGDDDGKPLQRVLRAVVAGCGSAVSDAGSFVVAGFFQCAWVRRTGLLSAPASVSPRFRGDWRG